MRKKMRSKVMDSEADATKMHHPKPGFLRRQWRKMKTEFCTSILQQYRRCVCRMKKCLRDNHEVETERRKSQAKLHPLPDRPLRRVASKLSRKPTNEIARLRKKGDDWTANDLFRFQYSDPDEGTVEQRKQLCYEWLDRLHDISKKYCYLAWYESAIYACYYRLAPILTDPIEKQRIWHDVKHEYAEIFMMARKIWRRAIHPSRLRVFYDLAMLCSRFGDLVDETVISFRDLMSDSTNFDFKVLNETEFIKSLDKVIKLENLVIDQFYKRRRSSGSIRSSFRSRRNTDCSPSRRSDIDEPTTSSNSAVGGGGAITRTPSDRSDRYYSYPPSPSPYASRGAVDHEDLDADVCSLAESLNQVSVSLPKASTVSGPAALLTIPTIFVEGPESRPASPRLVRFDDDEDDAAGEASEGKKEVEDKESD